MKTHLIAAAGLMLVSSPATAAPDDAALALYAAGDYQAAVDAAFSAGGAENLALAARALNAVAYFDDGRKAARRTASDALDFAEAALKFDPKMADAHLQAAISLSLRGNRMAPVRAFMLGIPAKVRKHLDDALALEPQFALALSTSAAWHLEVARRGGGAYGAVPEVGFGQFGAARALAPDDLVIAYECALRLLLSARAEWREPALEALAAALDMEPKTEFERRIKDRAKALAAAIEAGASAEAKWLSAHA